MMPRIALVDVNNFYVSCERVFNPELSDKPVVVLSNNDGAIVARSPEAKALGINNGEPWFKVEAMQKTHGLIGLSSNYELYGDLSARTMELLGRFAHSQSVYSIDECFLGLQGSGENLWDQATAIKQSVARLVGLPVCVGVAPTRTLAKFYNKLAKKNPHLDGVAISDLAPAKQIDQLMAGLPVDELWGVAGRLSKRLNGIGIYSIADLKAADPVRIRKKFSVVLQRTVLELNGIPCHDESFQPPAPKQIIFSRSFAHKVSTWAEMEGILSTYAQQAAIRLHEQGQTARIMNIFAGTSFFTPGESSYPAASIKLPGPTKDPVVLAKAAINTFRGRMVEGLPYARAGIILTGLEHPGDNQMFDEFISPHEERNISGILGEVRRKYGKQAIGLGRAGLATPAAWVMKREKQTPRYTTEWDELPLVNA